MQHRNTTRKHKKRMVGGANFKAYVYTFNLSMSVFGEYNDTNGYMDIDKPTIVAYADDIAEIINKLIQKGIDSGLGDFKFIQNVRVEHRNDTYFQIHCFLDVDKLDTRTKRADFLEELFTTVWEFYDDVEGLPLLVEIEELGEPEDFVREQRERANAATKAMIKGIQISRIREYIYREELLGRSIAALKTGFTKGTKADPAQGRGLSNMSPNILGRIGSFLSGKEGNLNSQRRQLRANIGFNNNEAEEGGAGAAAAAPERVAAGGAGKDPSENERRRSRRHRRGL
jgi:hypothetical protein